jgi:hypothetical protein
MKNDKTPAGNERFCKIAALSRGIVVVKTKHLLALRVRWKPHPRKAATTLAVSFF